MHIFRVPLLQRYILKELLQTFLMCSVSLLALVLITRIPYLRENFQGLNIQGSDFVKFFFYLIPSFLIILLPISCMLSVFLTFLRLNSDREFLAIKAGGISVYQLILAPALFSCLCMFLSFLVSLHGIAFGMTHFRELLLEIASTRAKVIIQPGVFNQDFIKGLTLFARVVDPVSGDLQQIIFEDDRITKSKKESNSNIGSITIIAPRGRISTDEETGRLVFSLFDGHVYRMSEKNVSILDFDEYAINIDLSEAFNSDYLTKIRPKDMSWANLRRTSHGGDGVEEKTRLIALTEIQKRLSLPFSCIVLGLFAVPLACSFEGVNRQIGMIISLSMFFLYYSFFSVGLSLGQSGKVPPIAALWASNVVFGILAITGFNLIAKERMFSLHLFAKKMVSSIKKRMRIS